MKKQLFGLVALTMMMAACSREDGDNANQPPSLFYTSTEQTAGDDIYGSHYVVTYNDDKTIKRYVMDAANYIPLYNKGKLTGYHVTYRADDAVGKPDAVFSYDDEGRVAKIGADSVVYDGKGQLAAFYHYPEKGAPLILTIFTWQNGNIVKATQIDYEYKDTTYLSYKYDDKRNAMAPLAFTSYHTGSDWNYHSRNNATEILYEEKYDGQITSTKTTYEYLEYNSESYPVKVKEATYYDGALQANLGLEYTLKYLPK